MDKLFTVPFPHCLCPYESKKRRGNIQPPLLRERLCDARGQRRHFPGLQTTKTGHTLFVPSTVCRTGSRVVKSCGDLLPTVHIEVSECVDCDTTCFVLTLKMLGHIRHTPSHAPSPFFSLVSPLNSALFAILTSRNENVVSVDITEI